MPGKDGLSTLEEFKEIRPHLPVVMVTKSEEETLMNDAIGQKIDDYLVKPVNPSQVLLVIKRLLDARKIISGSSMQRYITETNRFNQKLYGPVGPEDWFEAARILASWNLELDEKRRRRPRTDPDRNPQRLEQRIHQVCREQLSATGSTATKRPLLSPDVTGKYVIPRLKKKQKVLFVVVDCMRLDQWLMVEPLLAEFYNIQRDLYFSMLPSATPFARNALFAGMFPERDPPHLSRQLLARRGLAQSQRGAALRRQSRPQRGPGLGRACYEKVYNNTEGEALVKRAADFYDCPVVSMVFNFLDILAHKRSTNVILKEIAGTDAAFRSLMRSWFVHSPLFAILKAFAKRDFTVIVTSDHGSVLCKRGTMAHGKRSTSTNLRYKYGDNLNSDPKDSLLIKKPDQWKLPMLSLATTYIIAKEDFYFVYPNRYNEMVRQFQNSFQHGGISLEEMVVPLAVMTPR